jgi:hypothetical protein
MELGTRSQGAPLGVGIEHLMASSSARLKCNITFDHLKFVTRKNKWV